MTRVSEVVLLFLLNATWQVTLVALLASAADRLLRSAKARYQHLLWVLALAASVALPGSVFLHSAPAPIRDSVTTTQAQGRPVDRVADEQANTSPKIKTVRQSWLGMKTKLPVLRVARPLAIAALLLYVNLLLYRIGNLWLAWLRTRAVVQSALPIKGSAKVKINEALARCELAFDLKHLRVLSSTAVAVPIAARVLRPLVILPEYLLAEGDLDLLSSAIGHEAAHVARHDYLLNLIYELASLPLWFHPALTLLLRRIRRTRELSCDEVVAARLLRPSVYAQSLVQLAAAALPASRLSATIAVGIADSDILEERIMRILNVSPLASRRWTVLAAITVLLFVAPCLAAGAFAMQVAVRQPANLPVFQQTNAPSNSPAQSSASGQQTSGTASTPLREGQSANPSDLPEERETILVVAKSVTGQGRDGAASNTPGSRDDGKRMGTGKGVGVGRGVEGGVGGGVPGGVAGGVGGYPPKGPQHSQLEGITEGSLIQRIEPVYPEPARTAGLEGDVVFKATIGKTGALENLRAISGDPAFQAAALDAMKQWKFEPYRFNSEPVEIKTTITFKFRLAE